jgi:hydrogenase maturation factor
MSHDATTASALVDIDGRPTQVSTLTLGFDAAPIPADTWLVIHTGFAVSILSDAEADAIQTARADLAPSITRRETS